MPFLYLDAEAVAANMASLDIFGEMRALFKSLASGNAVQPPQTLTLLPGNEGDFITYLGALSDPAIFGAKLSPYLAREGGIVTAYTLLMSSETGLPLMLCDSLALTTERTAATSALAVDLLASENARRLAIIGTGNVGLAHLRHVHSLRSWSDIRLWSPAASSRSEAIAAIRSDARIAASFEEAVDGAEIVLLCTSSASSIFDPRDHQSCRLVTSISTNAPGAHEIAPDALASLDVYCDYLSTTPETAGEMLIARERGWDPATICGDLAAIVSGRVAVRPDRKSYFRSVGLGCEDIAVASALFSHISKADPQ